LQGLYIFLSYFGQFNFLQHAVGVFGPLQLDALPKFEPVVDGPCAWPINEVPLISPEKLQSYRVVATAPTLAMVGTAGALSLTGPASGSTSRHKHPDTFLRCSLNCTDPCNPFNNLGRSVSRAGLVQVHEAFVAGSKHMRGIMTEWAAHQEAQQKRSESGLGLTSDEQAAAMEADEHEAYRLISKLFAKTLSVYGSNGSHPGRAGYGPPVRRVTPVSNDSRLQQLSPSHIGTQSASPPKTTSSTASRVTSTQPPLDSNLGRILDSLSQAQQVEVPNVSEQDLVAMIRKLLLQYGSVRVGKLGSLLHNVMNNHSLPSILKERYGGLKKLLERHTDTVIIGSDHPFNPSTHLSAAALQLAQREALEAAQAEHAQQISHAGGNAGGYGAPGHQHVGGRGGGRQFHGAGGRGGSSQRGPSQQHMSQQQQMHGYGKPERGYSGAQQGRRGQSHQQMYNAGPHQYAHTGHSTSPPMQLSSFPHLQAHAQMQMAHAQMQQQQ
jgi:hypothetical protein